MVCHISCPHCRTNMFLTLTQQDGGTSCVGTITDLTAAEVARVQESAIHPDAVLALYKQMRAGECVLTPRPRRMARAPRRRGRGK